jgi:hypothetical protein
LESRDAATRRTRRTRRSAALVAVSSGTECLRRADRRCDRSAA